MFFLNKLCLSLVFCLHFIEYTLAFVPTSAVWGHSAALIDSKIYFTGGIHPQNPNDFNGVTPSSFSKEFFYLDVSTSFKVGGERSLPWVNLSLVSQILPKHSWSAFSNCGNDTLILYIGEFGEAQENLASSVYTFEINSQLWSNPPTTNQPNNQVHRQSQTVCDDKTRKMYRFSGSPRPSQSVPNPLPIINMDILDTWTRVGITIEAPEGRSDHTGTLLPSGYIVYIGGVFVDMSKLLLYNINDNTWNTMDATGNSPTSRGYHSAVLTKDGRIIVYGGYISIDKTASDDLVVLDTTTQPFTWSIANSTNSPPSRSYHTATMVGDYMIVAFGKDNINLPPPRSIFILYTGDKSDYKWIDEFPISTPCEINNNRRINKNFIIGIVILSSVLALIGCLFLIHLYRKRRQSRPDVRIAGNN